MKFEFEISKQQADKFIFDKITLSLHVANIVLVQIPHKLVGENIKRIEFEIQAEIFLHFMRSARDALLQEINKELFEPKLAQEKVRLNDILNILRSNKANGDLRSEQVLT